MKLRTRILVAAGLLVLLPLVLLALGGRRETARRLERQHAERGIALRAVLERSLDRELAALGDGLSALAADLRGDLGLRRSLAEPDFGAARRIGFAAERMRLMGWQYLLLQDEAGRVLSSGHFAESFGRLEPRRPRALAAAPGGAALLRARRPEGEFLAWVRVDSLDLDGRRYWLSGGREVDRDFLDALAGAGQLDLSLAGPAGVLVPGRGEAPGEPGPELALLAADGEAAAAVLRIAQPRRSLDLLLRGFDLWLLAALAVTGAGSLLLVAWVSTRLSRPLRELTAATERIDLERAEPVDLPADVSRRGDEVGALARTLGGLTTRLRQSARELREAERRATLGDLARQVTHDIRNGFTPLRNVVRHLSEVARSEPAALPALYREREGTLDSGLRYLEDLAAHYARLRPERSSALVDLNALLVALLPPELEERGLSLELELAPGLPRVEADAASLRRIVENLLRNARESLGEGGGCIRVRTELAVAVDGDAELRLTVSDTGRGIAPENLDRIFDDFYSSKPGGSGLGLSIVRRLAADLGGRIEAESRPGRGTRFDLRLPLPEREREPA